MTLSHQTEYLIKDEDVDSQYKHVHHHNIVQLLEYGRTQMMISLGIPNQMFIDRGELIVVTNMQVSFRREITAGKVIIRTFNPRVNSRKIVLDQSIVSPEGPTLTTATIDLLFVSAEKRAYMSVPEDFLAAFAF